MRKFTIGFIGNTKKFEENKEEKLSGLMGTKAPKKSVVSVYFPQRDMTLAYYNDLFDLQVGDSVYVDGKLEGMKGQVVEVNYSFKINLSYYKKVIAVVDTKLTGTINFIGSHAITFDRNMMPYEKARNWFFIDNTENDDYETGTDDKFFSLNELSTMEINSQTADRGHEYYMENKVLYICLDDEKGKAIVEGREMYQLEFDYSDGIIKNLVCSCYCNGYCKHGFAVMLQLKETLDSISKSYENEHKDYFACISKGVLFNTLLGDKASGKLTIQM